MRRHRGAESYMVGFQRLGIGEVVLERDAAASFRGLVRRLALSLKAFTQAEPRPHAPPMTLFVGESALMDDPVLSDAGLQVYSDAFKRNGFTGPLNWCRNFPRKWLPTASVRDVVTVPALMVSAADDILLPPATTAGMARHVADLERRLIADCEHST